MVVDTANLLGAGPDVIKKVVQQSSRDYMMQQLDVSGLEGLTQILLETVVVFVSLATTPATRSSWTS